MENFEFFVLAYNDQKKITDRKRDFTNNRSIRDECKPSHNGPEDSNDDDESDHGNETSDYDSSDDIINSLNILNEQYISKDKKKTCCSYTVSHSRGRIPSNNIL